jgi:hypothetical protein
MIAQALTTGTRADYAIGVAGASYQIGHGGHLVPVDVDLLDAVLLAPLTDLSTNALCHDRRLL